MTSVTGDRSIICDPVNSMINLIANNDHRSSECSQEGNMEHMVLTAVGLNW